MDKIEQACVYGLSHRTNNNVEGWHTHMRRHTANIEHIWKYVIALKKENFRNETLHRQMLAGATILYHERKYVIRDNRIKLLQRNLVSEEITALDFLRDIGYHCTPFDG